MTGPYSQGGDSPEDQGPVYGAPNPYGYQQPLPPPSMYGFGDPYAPVRSAPGNRGGTVFRQVEGHRWTVADLAGLLRNLWSRAPLYRKCRHRIVPTARHVLRAVHVGVPHRNSICDRNLDLGVRRRQRDTFGQCAGRCSPAIARMSREREPRKHVWGGLASRRSNLLEVR